MDKIRIYNNNLSGLMYNASYLQYDYNLPNGCTTLTKYRHRKINIIHFPIQWANGISKTNTKFIKFYMYNILCEHCSVYKQICPLSIYINNIYINIIFETYMIRTLYDYALVHFVYIMSEKYLSVHYYLITIMYVTIILSISSIHCWIRRII